MADGHFVKHDLLFQRNIRQRYQPPLRHHQRDQIRVIRRIELPQIRGRVAARANTLFNLRQARDLMRSKRCEGIMPCKADQTVAQHDLSRLDQRGLGKGHQAP